MIPAKTIQLKTGPRMSVNFLLLLIILAVLGGPLAAGDATSGVIVFLFVVAGWVVSLCLHEFGHAFVAYRGGDASVKAKGYLTLDPVRYADPLTSIVIPVAILALGGIGFPGGAVYIQRQDLRGPLWRAGMSLAGQAMTGVALLVCAAPFVLGVMEAAPPAFRGALALLCYIEATALLLNLLPIPGLDGFGVIEAFLPNGVLRAIAPFRSGATFLLIAVLFLAPTVSAPLFDASMGIIDALGVSGRAVGDGFDSFRFWNS